MLTASAAAAPLDRYTGSFDAEGVVADGPDATPREVSCDFKVLQEIARIGNGRYYHAEDPSNIPQIFAKETVTASKSAINEQPFNPIVTRPSQVIADIKFDDSPFLLGYVTTRDGTRRRSRA